MMAPVDGSGSAPAWINLVDFFIWCKASDFMSILVFSKVVFLPRRCFAFDALLGNKKRRPNRIV
jgi:hypothetical protein